MSILFSRLLNAYCKASHVRVNPDFRFRSRQDPANSTSRLLQRGRRLRQRTIQQTVASTGLDVFLVWARLLLTWFLWSTAAR
jgi:hypothetical protein